MLTNHENHKAKDGIQKLLTASTKKLLIHTQEKVFIKDKDLIYRGASLKFAQMAGWESPDDLIGKTDFEIFKDQELAQRYHNDDMDLIAQQQDRLDYIEPITEKDGHARYASTSKFVLTDADGQLLGIAGMSRDVTNEYYMKRHSIRALEYLFDLPPKVRFAVYMDLDEWRIISEHHQSVEGHEFAAPLHIDPLIAWAYEFIADRRWPAAAFYRDFSRERIADIYESGKKEIIMEYRRILPDGAIRWVRDEIHLLRDNISGHLCMMLVVWDVHAAKMEEEEQIRTAEHDELTGVLSRKATMRLIRERLERSFEGDRHALLMIDADSFKPVNDTYGHQAGDKVLVDLAREISASFRSSDIVGRIGGDEFFVLMTHVPDRSTVEKKIAALLDKIRRVHYEDIYLSASIGICMFPDDAGTLDEMYTMADKAMYAAKKERDSFVFMENLTAEQLQADSEAVQNV